MRSRGIFEGSREQGAPPNPTQKSATYHTIPVPGCICTGSFFLNIFAQRELSRTLIYGREDWTMMLSSQGRFLFGSGDENVFVNQIKCFPLRTLTVDSGGQGVRFGNALR